MIAWAYACMRHSNRQGCGLIWGLPAGLACLSRVALLRDLVPLLQLRAVLLWGAAGPLAHAAGPSLQGTSSHVQHAFQELYGDGGTGMGKKQPFHSACIPAS